MKSAPVNELGKLIDAARVGRVRRAGALVFDVDDTLLARERAGGAGVETVAGTLMETIAETFAESAPAALLPELLRRGFNLCFITGHGWQQLQTRLVAPIIESLRESGDSDDARACIERLRVYANRGATKIAWDGERYAVDEVYGARHQLRDADRATLRELLEILGAEFDASFRARREWFQETFPRFDFATLPARVSEREGAVLVLRPIPARRHAADGVPNPRAQLYERGLELLRGARLGDRYELAESGRSSIEITRRGVSKEAAMRDLIRELTAATGEDAARAEASLVYVGDEFFAGGNDSVIPRLFPRALCLSVAAEGAGVESQAGVVPLARSTGAQGTAATEALLKHVLNLSARV
jgi:hydroxymethylpyrimidine pyrophosphatase-like HAD family hydrolase